MSIKNIIYFLFKAIKIIFKISLRLFVLGLIITEGTVNRKRKRKDGNESLFEYLTGYPTDL